MPEKEVTCCERLEVKDGEYAHQRICDNYQDGQDADKLRRALKGVELRWWTDQVLEAHPNRQILNMKVKADSTRGVPDKYVTIDPYFEELEEDHPHYKYKSSYIVTWILPGVTLTIGRGFTLDPLTGEEMSVYAVQEIEQNEERKRPIKPKSGKH